MATVVNKITISANASVPTQFVRLNRGPNRVDVNYNDGVTATITPFQTTNIDKPEFYRNVYLNSEAAVFTSPGKEFIITGPVYLGFKCESLSGGTVEIEIQDA